jgi:predicted dienelactone hydrolase
MTPRSIVLGLAVLVGGTLGGTAAHGADACLTGAAVLGDQRALAALRVQEEAACPCGSATGRSAYRRCARPLVKDALDTGAVRSECKKMAKQDVSGATCGTDRVACGGLDLNHLTKGATCKVKPAAGCHDRGSHRYSSCTAETHCSDVVTWTAGTCVDGRNRGPSNVGARQVTFTKPSVLDPTQTRVLSTVIWYPTADSGPVDSAVGAILDATVDTAGAPHPIVLFSHGECGFPTQSRFLTVQLASYGYVVVAPSHPESTIADCAGGTNNIIRSALERPAEISSVLDQMLALNGTPSSPFFGIIDPDRAGMSGHSFGGWTTFKVAAADARFKVAVPMAGDPAVPPALTVPLLAMTGLVDSVVPPATVAAAYNAAGPPKILVQIENAGHFAFSDGCFPGFTQDCNYPVTLSQDEAHAVVLRWVVPFLERYLRGAPRLDTFFATPPPPGVVIESAF